MSPCRGCSKRETAAHEIINVQTVGAAEHTFKMNSGTERGMEWKIYDVGGTRTQRQTWVPFFDDVNAILFLAPISAFDQMLNEDRRVNR